MKRIPYDPWERSTRQVRLGMLYGEAVAQARYFRMMGRADLARAAAADARTIAGGIRDETDPAFSLHDPLRLGGKAFPPRGPEPYPPRRTPVGEARLCADEDAHFYAEREHWLYEDKTHERSDP